MRYLIFTSLTFCIFSTQLFAVSFSDGRIYDINYTINDNVNIDQFTPNSQTTINLIENGNITLV